MNILLIRHRRKGECIDGQLYLEEARLCDTAENALRSLKAGTYPIALVKCKVYGRKMPVIGNGNRRCHLCHASKQASLNTKQPVTCPMLRAGNGIHKRQDGAIRLGEYICPGCLKHPKTHFLSCYNRLRKATERGHRINLTIQESYHIPHKKNKAL